MSMVRKPRSLEESWKRCGARLRAELGEAIFSSWFGRLELEGVVNRQARFTVPTRFLKSWIESHYLDRILAALNSEVGEVASLTLAVRSSTQATPRRRADGRSARGDERGAASRDWRCLASRRRRRARAPLAVTKAPPRRTRFPARLSTDG